MTIDNVEGVDTSNYRMCSADPPIYPNYQMYTFPVITLSDEQKLAEQELLAELDEWSAEIERLSREIVYTPSSLLIMERGILLDFFRPMCLMFEPPIDFYDIDSEEEKVVISTYPICPVEYRSIFETLCMNMYKKILASEHNRIVDFTKEIVFQFIEHNLFGINELGEIEQ